MSVAYLDSPPRYGRGTGHKACSLCGQTGHQRNSPIHRAQRAAAIPEPDADTTPALAQLRAGDFQRHSSTIPAKPLSHAEKRVAALTVLDDSDRPKTRGDCKGGPRPCPWVSCAHSLYLDVNPETGAIKLNHPDKEPWELKESCVLDIADRGALTLEEAGVAIGLTRERVRQLEERSLRRLKRSDPAFAEAGGPTPHLQPLDDRIRRR